MTMGKHHQPMTTDTTNMGRKIARNSLRLQLWADDAFAHAFMCHPGKHCRDGCNIAPMASRLALYQSELEM
jgi:hypothetical protein